MTTRRLCEGVYNICNLLPGRDVRTFLLENRAAVVNKQGRFEGFSSSSPYYQIDGFTQLQSLDFDSSKQKNKILFKFENDIYKPICYIDNDGKEFLLINELHNTRKKLTVFINILMILLQLVGAILLGVFNPVIFVADGVSALRMIITFLVIHSVYDCYTSAFGVDKILSGYMGIATFSFFVALGIIATGLVGLTVAQPLGILLLGSIGIWLLFKFALSIVRINSYDNLPELSLNNEIIMHEVTDQNQSQIYNNDPRLSPLNSSGVSDLTTETARLTAARSNNPVSSDYGTVATSFRPSQVGLNISGPLTVSATIGIETDEDNDARYSRGWGGK